MEPTIDWSLNNSVQESLGRLYAYNRVLFNEMHSIAVLLMKKGVNMSRLAFGNSDGKEKEEEEDITLAELCVEGCHPTIIVVTSEKEAYFSFNCESFESRDDVVAKVASHFSSV
jgi:hypothetical protein